MGRVRGRFVVKAALPLVNRKPEQLIALGSPTYNLPEE